MRYVLVCLALLGAAACQRSSQGALDHLHPCGINEGPPDAWCGTHRVFEDRAAKSGRTIDLKIVVAPALRRDPQPDPLFIFEGGPGGGAATLADQAKGPILNPGEMAMPSDTEVIAKLKAISSYPKDFAKAFPGEKEPVTYDNLAKAIAAFERTLVTHDRLDDFLNGKDEALTAAELKGLNLFVTVGCTTCHNGPVIGGNSFSRTRLCGRCFNKAFLWFCPSARRRNRRARAPVCKRWLVARR